MFELLLVGFLIVSLVINVLVLLGSLQPKGLRTIVLDDTLLAFAEPAWQKIQKMCTRAERKAIVQTIEAEARQNRVKRRLENDPDNAKLEKQLSAANTAYETALIVYNDIMLTATRRWLRTAEGTKWRDDHGIHQNF